jgi:hypothetical protein
LALMLQDQLLEVIKALMEHSIASLRSQVRIMEVKIKQKPQLWASR